MMDDAVFGGLLILRRQELVEHAVERGKLADLSIADQVDTVKASAEGLQSLHVAVVAKQVEQKTGGKAAALRPAAGGDASNRGKEPVGGDATLGQYFFDARRFLAKDERVLNLLRVDSQSILGEQGYGLVGSNHIREHTRCV